NWPIRNVLDTVENVNNAGDLCDLSPNWKQ
ncbi:MAG: hypothetical protein ACI932_000893, partial [Paracoccaceae bacterium]